MRPFRKLAFAVISVTFAFGCASTSTDLEKAAHDLQCPDDEITVTRQGDNTFLARGCGRQIAYESYGPRTLANPGKNR